VYKSALLQHGPGGSSFFLDDTRDYKAKNMAISIFLYITAQFCSGRKKTEKPLGPV